MLQRNTVKCNCHRLKYLVLYYKSVIALILRNTVPRSISYFTRKLVKYDILLGTILYKYILLVRVTCEKYRLRGEANIPSHLFDWPRNRYFSQITLTNRIYLFNSAEYLTANKTVACMQAGSELQTTSFIWFSRFLSIYENRKNLFKEVYFWNKIKK